jgi:D-xylose 1-dehydrogenase (NADP+, D-xylono-1,5-lactone-forming)
MRSDEALTRSYAESYYLDDHNNRDGTFTDVTKSMAIDGPSKGFSLADQWDNPGLPRHPRESGDRGDRVRARLPEARMEADPNTEMITDPGIRWGILGCARIARRGLIPGIAASRTGFLHALASRDRTTARAWAEEFGLSRAYGSYEELVDDPEIQAVYIPLPNELHKPWVLRAADAGKHVLCEKPLALDAVEALDMVEHCRSRGILLMEAFMWRHQPRSLELRAKAAAGVIGELRLIRSSFSFPIEEDDWRLNPARGGGALWDVGCYGLNTARFFAGAEPETIRGLGRFGWTGVDMSLTANVRFPGGLLAAIDCSFEQPFRCTIELVGTKGVIEVPDAYLPPADGKPLARFRIIGDRSDSDAQSDPIQVLEFEAGNQYAAMVDAFASSIAAGRLVDPAEDGLAQMAGLDAILAAARQRNI